MLSLILRIDQPSMNKGAAVKMGGAAALSDRTNNQIISFPFLVEPMSPLNEV